jgi:hypothetical protein
MSLALRAPSLFVRSWNDFFHAPLDLRICALVRIGYAALVLVWLAVLYPDLAAFFTDDGLLPLNAAGGLMPGGAWSVLAWLPQDAVWVGAAYGMAVAHALFLLVGLASRINAAAVFVWIVSFCNRNPLIMDGEDAVFRLIGFYLLVMPCGACWSLDAWLARWRMERQEGDAFRSSQSARKGSAWGLRLLQVQMCVIFLSAAICKLQQPEWRDGTAMYYTSRLSDYFGRFPTPDFLWQSPELVALLTWSVIAVELVIPLAIWWRPARLPALAAFHLANEYAMHLFLFHWIMLVGWASFLTGRDLEWMGCLFRARRNGPLQPS